MSDREEGPSVEIALNRFTSFYRSVLNLKSIESLEFAIGDASTQIETEIDMDNQDALELLDTVLKAAKQTRRELSTDLGELHHLLCDVMISLDSSEDDGASLNRKVRIANKWLVELQVKVKPKSTKRELEKYFQELENMRNELMAISNGTEDIAKTYYRILENERRLGKEVEHEQLKNEKLEEKYKKAKNAYEDLKNKYQELYKKHEALKNQNESLKEQVVKYMTQLNRDPSEDKEELPQEQYWFDIEKSQKRYEDLLDKHKDVSLDD